VTAILVIIMTSTKTTHPTGVMSEELTSLLTFPGDGAVSLSDPAVRQAIYDAHSGVDFYTGQALALEQMRLDHVFPRSQGGADSVYNLVPTSARINGKKGAKVDHLAVAGVLYIVRTRYAPAVLKQLRSGDVPRPQKRTKAQAEAFPYSQNYDFLSPRSAVQTVSISTDKRELVDILDAADKEQFRLREHKIVCESTRVIPQ